MCEIHGHHFAVQTVPSVPVGSALMVSTITNNEWAGADVTLVVILDKTCLRREKFSWLVV